MRHAMGLVLLLLLASLFAGSSRASTTPSKAETAAKFAQAAPGPNGIAHASSRSEGGALLRPNSTLAPRANQTRFTDPAGDGGGGPDVSNVTVSNDNAGALTFVVEIPSHGRLPADGYLAIFLDTDVNPATGSSGAEFLIFVDGPDNTIGLNRWSGSQFDLLQNTGIQGSSVTGGEQIKLNNSALGGPAAFDMSIVTLKADLSFADGAPNSGDWRYNVVLAPPARAIKVGSRGTLGDPEVGKVFQFSVSFVFADNGRRVAGGNPECVAQIGKRRLGTSKRTFRRGTVTCFWKMPAWAAGKQLRALAGLTRLGEHAEDWDFWNVLGKPSLRILPPENKRPEAGQYYRMSVKVAVVRVGAASTGVTEGKAICRATVDGQALDLNQGKVFPGGAGCIWLVPLSARGKTLIATITVRAEGLSARAVYRYTVR